MSRRMVDTSREGTLLRTALTVALVAVFAYSLVCAVMISSNREGPLNGFLLTVWSRKGLSEDGLKWRNRHMWSFVIAVLLVCAWFVWIEPL